MSGATASRVRSVRQALGLTQNDLAFFLMCSTPYISRMEAVPNKVPDAPLQRLVLEALESIVREHPTVAAREVRAIMALDAHQRYARLFTMAGSVRS